jgi:hypothetical protein
VCANLIRIGPNFPAKVGLARSRHFNRGCECPLLARTCIRLAVMSAFGGKADAFLRRGCLLTLYYPSRASMSGHHRHGPNGTGG